MQNQIEKQTIPTAKAVFLQGQGGRSPEVKRCGYCGRLVRWTLQEGRNVAVNSDGSRHRCLTDRTAKREQPAKHARPSQDEVATFLACEQEHESSSTEPTRDFEVNEKHNIAANEAQTEAMSRLADAMLKVAKSNNTLADYNRRLAKMYSRLAHAIELAEHPCR